MDTRVHCYRKAARLSSLCANELTSPFRRGFEKRNKWHHDRHHHIQLFLLIETSNEILLKMEMIRSREEKERSFSPPVVWPRSTDFLRDATFDLCSLWLIDKCFFAVHCCCPNYGDIISPVNCVSKEERRTTIYHRLIKEQHKMFEFMSLA